MGSTTLVISQFQTSGATGADEFVEIHNISKADVDLNGYRLVYRDRFVTSDLTIIAFTTSTIVPSGGYYLVTHQSGYDGVVAGDATYFGSVSGILAGAYGGFAIRHGAENTGALVDAVAWGNVPVSYAYREGGTATTAPASNASKSRLNAGTQDTDNTSADFETLATSAPRNSLTTAFLPVELVSFTGAADGTAARLTWTTASETNNAGFSIERQTGQAWHEVAFVTGRGTTSEAHTYTRTMSGLIPGRHAFRLVQRDLDGTATIAGTVEVVITAGGRLSIYPSPARTSIRIEGLTEAADVVDALGRVVARAVPGEALSVASWAPGIYVVMSSEPQRFVVAR